MITERIIHAAESAVPFEKKVRSVLSKKRVLIPVLTVSSAVFIAAAAAVQFSAYHSDMGAWYNIAVCLLTFPAIGLTAELFTSVFSFRKAGYIVSASVVYLMFSAMHACWCVWTTMDIGPNGFPEFVNALVPESLVLYAVPFVLALVVSLFVLRGRKPKGGAA